MVAHNMQLRMHTCFPAMQFREDLFAFQLRQDFFEIQLTFLCQFRSVHNPVFLADIIWRDVVVFGAPVQPFVYVWHRPTGRVCNDAQDTRSQPCISSTDRIGQWRIKGGLGHGPSGGFRPVKLEELSPSILWCPKGD